VNSAFFLSNGIRQDVELYLALQGPPEPPKALKFVGSELRYLNPDERSTAALVRTALIKKCGGEWTRSTPGIYASKKTLSDVLRECATANRDFVYLKENGTALGQAKLRDPVIILGDQFDLSVEEEELLKPHNPATISLGPHSLHTDHCITIINNELDRMD
jgi:tRNA (pseudouridine54-N1)-methyltransferase